MSDKIGLLTGSFDPVTNGHVNLMGRAAQLFDNLYVGLFYNKNKDGFFSVEERQLMLEGVIKNMQTVKLVTAHDSLAVDIARQLGVTHLVRGLRNSTDLEYEANLTFFNHHLAADIETVFLLSPPDLAPISSSRIRELIHFRSDISDFVPQCVVKEVEKKYQDEFRNI